MSDPIDRQAAIETICTACSIEEDYHKCDGYKEGSDWCDYVSALRKLPSTQERKSGEWIFDPEPYPLGNPYGHYGCDQCGEYVPHKTNFCPNCGTRMEELENDKTDD